MKMQTLMMSSGIASNFSVQSSKSYKPEHDSYYSTFVTPNKTSFGPTPKSILKEPMHSDTKAKRNILINENLNEVHNPKKNQRSQSKYSEKRPKIVAPQDRDNIGYRSNLTIGGPLEGRYGKIAEQYIISPPFAKDKNAITSFPQTQTLSPESLLSSQGKDSGNNLKGSLSEFQKAYIRRLQRERELELYSESLAKSSHDSNFDEIGNNYGFSEREFRGDPNETGKSQETPHNWKFENLSNLDKIEDKISELERNFDLFSQKLKSSIEKQKDLRLENENVLQKALTPQVRSDKENANDTVSTIRSSSIAKERKKHRKLEKSMNEDQETVREKSESKVSRASSPIIKYKNPIEKNSQFIELRQELEGLKEENEKLRLKILNERNRPENKNGKSQQLSEIVEKEKKLLDLIEKMKSKLQKSIMKNTIKIDQSSSLPKCEKEFKANQRIETLARPRKTYNLESPRNVNFERYKLSRKAYGSHKLEKENAHLLNQGLSSTSNGFLWNADQDLTIRRNYFY